MKQITYTTKMHAHRLTQMLNKDKPCGCCPAGRNFSSMVSGRWKRLGESCNTHSVCNICRTFIGLQPQKGLTRSSTSRCPCFTLGEAKAIQRTHEALAKYYGLRALE